MWGGCGRRIEPGASVLLSPGDGKCSPPARSGSFLLPPYSHRMASLCRQDGTDRGQVLTQMELRVLIWVPEQLLIVPWGAGLV